MTTELTWAAADVEVVSVGALVWTARDVDVGALVWTARDVDVGALVWTARDVDVVSVADNLTWAIGGVEILERAYSPSQQRDRRGRWSATSIHGGTGEFSEASKKALTEYTGNDYSMINGSLRQGIDYQLKYFHGPSKVQMQSKIEGQIAAIDGAMKVSVTHRSIVVERGMSPAAFTGTDDGLVNSKFSWKSIEGAKFTDKGYVSTSIGKTGWDWSGAIAEIHVPVGTHAVDVSSLAANPDLKERELLLDRNQTFRVDSVIAPKVKTGGAGRESQHRLILSVVSK